MSKTAQTTDEFFEIQEKFQGKPHGWVQWKGTDVCMDVHCSCGCMSHIDAAFAYYVECPECSKKYACNGHIELVEITFEPPSASLIKGE